MTKAELRLQKRYEELWSNAIESLRTGGISIDPVLASGELDKRRGLSVMIRPPADVQARITRFVEELKVLEPDQHFYASAELHVTFLSLFTATEQPESFLSRTAAYADSVAACVSNLPAFTLRFRGVTASPATVMIQGFGEIEILNAGRDQLRSMLRERGLAEGLDQRYHLKTAHMTIARFRQPLRDGKRLASFLEEHRATDFGCSRVSHLELVKNDWYLSQSTTEILASYSLASTRSDPKTGPD